MKKYLLFAIAFVCTSIGAWAGETTITQNNPSPGSCLFTIDEDPSLSNVNWYNGSWYPTINDVVDNGGSLKFVGKTTNDNVVNASGIETLISNLANYKSNISIDVSEITLNGQIITLPAKPTDQGGGYVITGLIYTNNTALPSWLGDSNFKYALSNGSTNSYLYAAQGQTALPSGLTIVTDGSVTYHLSGEGANAMKTALMNAGVPEASIDMSSATSFTSTINCAGNAVTFNLGEDGGNLASAIAKAANLFSSNSSLRHAKFTGTINADDLAALKNFNFTNGESIDLSKVTLSPATLAQTGDFSFNDTENSNPNLKYVILPRNVDEIDQTWFTTLTNLNAAITYSYDATDNSKLQAYVKTANTLAETIVRLAADKCNQYQAEYDEDLNVSFKTGASGANSINLAQTAENGATHGKKVNAVKITGNISARDISDNSSKALVFDENGHFVFNEPATETTDQTRTLVGTSQLCGLAGADLVSIDLGGVETISENDLTLSYTGSLSANTKQVVIPTSPSVTTLPADFMNMDHGVFQICIPANIQNIKTRAFMGHRIDHIWTTSSDPTVKVDNGIVTAVDENGKATSVAYGQLPLTTTVTDYKWGTYTLPAGLKLIESYAFGTNEGRDPRVKDLYVLNPIAPECHVDAFPPIMYIANNRYASQTINDEGIITRDAYRNSDDAFTWATMLHYPRETQTPNIQRYMDVTREYTVATGDVDGRGAPIYYPTQVEFNRAFQQGTTGYLWNAWDPTRSTNGDGLFSNSLIDGYNPVATNWTGQMQDKANAEWERNATTPMSTKAFTSFYDVTTNGGSQPSGLVPYDQVYWDESAYALKQITGDEDPLYDGKDYRGWHQFVLTSYAANSKLVFEPIKSYITDNDWWTICAPYDLRYSDIILLFGDPNNSSANLPYLSKLLYVVRDVKNKKITLMFSKNLMVYKEVEPTTSNSINIAGTHVHGEINDENTWPTEGLGTGENNPVILHAGVPYLIKPNLPASAKRQFDIYRSQQAAGLSVPAGAIVDDWLYNSFKTARSLSGDEQKQLIYKGEYKVPAYVINNTGDYPETTYGTGVSLPIALNDGSAFSYSPTGFSYNNATSAEMSQDFTYTFVGTFYKSLMPQYCYFLGWDSSLNNGQGGAAFWYNKFNDPANYTWNNETGIICPNWSLSHKITRASSEGTMKPARWEATVPTDITPDDFGGANEAKGYMEMTFGNDMWLDEDLGGATAVKEVTTTNSDGIIYDVHGVKMGTSFVGLAKGVYIMNGKKYIIK